MQVEKSRKQNRGRWWWILVQPALLLAAAAFTLVLVGAAQRAGWLQGPVATAKQGASSTAETLYICPMMCTPPQREPGRCPVCAMELVPSASNQSGPTDSIELDPAARRLAHIETAVVRRRPFRYVIESIGEIAYDEGTLKTIAAYVDGRLEQLSVDYTGAEVDQGDRLAVVYSPHLYSAQIEFLLARQAAARRSATPLGATSRATTDLYGNARQRLIEYGMTDSQVAALEQSGQANSRLELYAPMRGTVIRKLVREGQYVREGQAIYELADLSTVWLMLRLFPDDAAKVRFGLPVTAQLRSLPNETVRGRVVFVDPHVDPKTQTVGVRVVLDNHDRRLRIGDYAEAAIEVPIDASGNAPDQWVDEELAGKWIGPRHPHVVHAEAAACPICGEALVPAADFGIVRADAAREEPIVVPRSSILHVGSESVVYAATSESVFQLRRVVCGPSNADEVVVVSGLAEGDRVATSGAFLIDSQMQLAGNPSLIDTGELEVAAPDSNQVTPDVPLPTGMGVGASEPQLSPSGNTDAVQPEVPIPSTMQVIGEDQR